VHLANGEHALPPPARHSLLSKEQRAAGRAGCSMRGERVRWVWFARHAASTTGGLEAVRWHS
jgi:hypothetical protein